MDYNMRQTILVQHRCLYIDSWAQCISQYYHCNSQNIVELEAAGLFILCILRQSQASLPSLLLDRKGWLHIGGEGISKELGEHLWNKIKMLDMVCSFLCLRQYFIANWVRSCYLFKGCKTVHIYLITECVSSIGYRPLLLRITKMATGRNGTPMRWTDSD